MKQCWHLTARMRPSFVDLEQRLCDMAVRAARRYGAVRELGEELALLNASAV